MESSGLTSASCYLSPAACPPPYTYVLLQFPWPILGTCPLNHFPPAPMLSAPPHACIPWHLSPYHFPPPHTCFPSACLCHHLPLSLVPLLPAPHTTSYHYLPSTATAYFPMDGPEPELELRWEGQEWWHGVAGSRNGKGHRMWL